MNPTIELNRLEVQLGSRTILRGLTGVLKSRAIGLLGPNGAGKSTLINTLLGFHSPSKGSAHVLGLDSHTNGKALRSLVGYMPENDAFVSKMSGVRFVRYMAEVSGLPPDQAMERAHEAFVYVGLGEARYRPVGTYSLGMKQLAKLAQAIAHGPKVLILDEPTNGMDPPARKRLIELIREIREASDICLLLSSHLLRDVEETCDEVLILRNGQIASICNLVEERRTNRKFLELETIGAEATFTSTLEGLGCECAVFSNGRIKVVMPESVEIREVFKVAADRGVQIRRMNYRRDSLEDIFLNAIADAGMVAVFCAHPLCLRRPVQISRLRCPVGSLHRPLPVFCWLHFHRQQPHRAIADAVALCGFIFSGKPILHRHSDRADASSFSVELLGWPRLDRRRSHQRRSSTFSESAFQQGRLCSWKAHGVGVAALRCHLGSLLALIQSAGWLGNGWLDLVALVDGRSYRVLLRNLDPHAFAYFPGGIGVGQVANCGYRCNLHFLFYSCRTRSDV